MSCLPLWAVQRPSGPTMVAAHGSPRLFVALQRLAGGACSRFVTVSRKLHKRAWQTAEETALERLNHAGSSRTCRSRDGRRDRQAGPRDGWFER
jgi:hypothetical protein